MTENPSTEEVTEPEQVSPQTQTEEVTEPVVPSTPGTQEVTEPAPPRPN